MERSYFLFTNSQQTGLFTLEQARQQPVNSATMVWYEGLSGWVAIGNVDELKDLVGAPPGPVPHEAPTPAGAPQPSYGTAGPDVIPRVPGYPSDAVLATEIDKHHRLLITYILSCLGALILTAILVAGLSAGDMEEGAVGAGILFGAATLALVVLYIVHFCKFHYRCWEVAIARTGFNEYPPGQAVGLLFVPLFNLYWYFKSYHQLAILLGQAINRGPYDRSFTPNAGTALTLCILNLVSLIPWLGSLAALVNIVLWFVIIGENRRACTHLLRSSGI